jgi:hypothetical protein
LKTQPNPISHLEGHLATRFILILLHSHLGLDETLLNISQELEASRS